jgi:hypothetical protein
MSNPTTKNLNIFPVDNKQTTTTDIHNNSAHILKRIQLSTKQQQRLAKSETYKRKYQPLPPTTTVPHIDPREMAKGTWDLWEWWSGTGTLSRTARHIGLVTGPPVSRETGWDLSLPHHQTALLHLQSMHEPWILFGSPVCAPWSQACTTMDPELKIIIRDLEEATFSFYAKACLTQHRNGRYYLFEQPRNSKLGQTETAIELETKTNGQTYGLCMCMHQLQCPITKKPYMKPTV